MERAFKMARGYPERSESAFPRRSVTFGRASGIKTTNEPFPRRLAPRPNPVIPGVAEPVRRTAFSGFKPIMFARLGARAFWPLSLGFIAYDFYSLWQFSRRLDLSAWTQTHNCTPLGNWTEDHGYWWRAADNVAVCGINTGPRPASVEWPAPATTFPSPGSDTIFRVYADPNALFEFARTRAYERWVPPAGGTDPYVPHAFPTEVSPWNSPALKPKRASRAFQPAPMVDPLSSPVGAPYRPSPSIPWAFLPYRISNPFRVRSEDWNAGYRVPNAPRKRSASSGGRGRDDDVFKELVRLVGRFRLPDTERNKVADDIEREISRGESRDLPDMRSRLRPRTGNARSFRPGRPPVRSKPAGNRPPRKREKEPDKVRGSKQFLKIASWAINAVTESADAVNSVYKGLPWQLRAGAKWECDENGAYCEWRWSKQNWLDRPLSIQDKAQAIVDHYDKLDLNKAVDELVENQIEDFIYGKAGTQLKKSSKQLQGFLGGSAQRGFGVTRLGAL